MRSPSGGICIRPSAQWFAGEDLAEALEQARRQWEQTQRPARVFSEFQHETVSGTWSRKRRVAAKAEHLDGKSNPRFIVTSLPAESWAARPSSASTTPLLNSLGLRRATRSLTTSKQFPAIIGFLCLYFSSARPSDASSLLLLGIVGLALIREICGLVITRCGRPIA